MDFGYEIDDQNLKHNFDVMIFEDETLVGGVLWTKYQSTIDANKYSEIYYIETNLNEKLVISFGDNTIGKRPFEGSYIKVTYGVTQGDEANGYRNIDIAEPIYSATGEEFSSANLIITNHADTPVTIGGTAEESLLTIKNNAPKFYEAQNRSVTLQDYRTILEKIKFEDDQVEFDIANVWEGPDENPPIYGTIISVFKPTELVNGEYQNFTDYQKEQIINSIKPYMPLALKFEIRDAIYIYINISSTVYYSYAYTNPEDSIKENIINWFNEYINTYNSQIKYSNLLSLIDQVDGVSNNLTETTFHIKFNSTISSSKNYIFNLYNELKPGSIYSYFNEIIDITDDSNGNIIDSDGNIIGSIDYIEGRLDFSYDFDKYLEEGETIVNAIELYFDTKYDDIYFLKNCLPILNDSDINITTIGN